MTIDESVLTDVVREMLGDNTITLSEWEVQPLVYDALSRHSGGINRISGSYPVAWSVIVKRLLPSPSGIEGAPHDPFFWRRESLIYPSGLLADLPYGVGVPRFYMTSHASDGSISIWMQDLGIDRGKWSPDRLMLAARHIGRLGGMYLVEMPLPDASWLSRGVIRAWAQESAPLMDRAKQAAFWSHPLLRDAFSEDLWQGVLALWDYRGVFCSELEKLPQTLTHNDFWSGNLFSRFEEDDEPETTIIDWELAGLGAPGEDAGNLIGAGLLNFDLEPSQAEDLADLLLIAYLNGLADAGWRGDPQPIRFAFNASAALRSVFSAAGWPIAIANERTGAFIEETEARWNRPIEAIFAHWAAVTELLLGRADDARRDLGKLKNL